MKSRASFFILIIAVLILSCASGSTTLSKGNKNFSIIKQVSKYSYKVDRDSVLLDSGYKPKVKQLNHKKSYNKYGDIVEYSGYKKNGRLNSIAKSYYNASRKFDSVLSFNADGILKTKNLYFYNSKNKIIKIRTFDINDNLISEQFNAFVSNKFISLRSHFYKQNTKSQINFTYNKKGYLKSSVSYSDSPYFESQRDYIRDNDGKILIENFKNSQKTIKKYFKYDANGSIIESKNIDLKMRHTDIYTYKYNYDDQQNWITKLTYSNGKLILAEERDIEYY